MQVIVVPTERCCFCALCERAGPAAIATAFVLGARLADTIALHNCAPEHSLDA